MDPLITGRVSAVYPERRTAKVVRDDRGTVTGELSILDRGDNWLPVVGEYVVALRVPRSSSGYILGRDRSVSQ